jgi:hypothetical protein
MFSRIEHRPRRKIRVIGENLVHDFRNAGVCEGNDGGPCGFGIPEFDSEASGWFGGAVVGCECESGDGRHVVDSHLCI